MIPNQLKGCNFNRVLFKQKKAFESGWQNKPYTYDEISKHFPKDNYGVICGDDVRVLDDDTSDKRLISMFTEIFGETFRVRDHLYFKFDNSHSKKILLFNDDEHLGEIQGENTYVVGPGSTHPSGELYDVKNDKEIITIEYDKFMEFFSVFIKSNDTQKIKVDTSLADLELINLILPKWEEGKRQEIAMAVSGYLRKELKYGFNHALQIIQKVCEVTNDKDFNERASIVKQTYMKDERDVKGIKGMAEFNILPENEKKGIIWSKKVKSFEHSMAISSLEIKGGSELLIYAHDNDIIKGKPIVFDNNKKTNITLISVWEKKDKESGNKERSIKFIGDSFDKRYDGFEVSQFSKAFWVYQVIDEGNEYIALLDEKFDTSEIQYLYGMKMSIANSNEISSDLKCKGNKNVFLCKSYEPTIKALPKEEIMPKTLEFIEKYKFCKEDFKNFFTDFIFTHEDGNIYRQPEDYMLMRHAQLLSGKVNGYPLSTISLGVPGCSKTMEIECMDQVFGEGIMEAGNSTVKSLVPSFKEKPASSGYIMSSNRIALIDEMMKMVDKQMEGNASTSIIKNQLSQLNYLLEHKRRSVGSGNDNTFTGQATAKSVMVGNPAGRMNFLSDHLKVLDESTLSRLFIWIKGFEHKKFVQSNKIVKSRDIHPNHIHVFEEMCSLKTMFRDFIYNYYLTIYDSCQQFISDIEYDMIESLYNQTLALVPYELKNVWGARGRHHTELVIDGITKFNTIFVKQKGNFKADDNDYLLAERILIKMAESWSYGLTSNL